MSSLSSFAITQTYPPRDSNRLQLYSFPTPNGVKVSIMLEELGLDYDAHRVDITQNQTWSDEFLMLNPNGKIPVIIDPNTQTGEPLVLFESGAILFYLAEKTGKFLPENTHERMQSMQWLFWQMSGVGPMFGQVGFFHAFAGKDIEDKRPLMRYVNESKRLLQVLEGRLENRQWIMGEQYGLVDIAFIGWVRVLTGMYDAGELLEYNKLKNVPAWLESCLARPAVQKGLQVPQLD